MSAELRKLLDDWAVPDPHLVGKLPRAGIQLDYLGHAEVTRALIECDPCWTWRPFSLAPDGAPLVSIRDKTASMWIALTVHGVERIGVGTAPAAKDDVLKELVSDALRNAAMRFGVALSLWSKQEWQESSGDDSWPVRTVKGGIVHEVIRELKVDEQTAKDLAHTAWVRCADEKASYPADEAKQLIDACVSDAVNEHAAQLALADAT